MRSIKLLDCTLRDGGYVNDWKFGRENLTSIFERLVDTGVDVIEVGFLDERRPFDIDRSIMPDTASVERIYGGLDRKNAMVVGMIDYGTCSIDKIQPCSESYLDGIRVIFKKHLMHEAMEYCRAVKALGYRVFSQLVSITSYHDEELLQLIDLVNDVKPYAVSMVDTYGLLHPEDLLHYYRLLDDHLCAEVEIGFHAHNNFQLGYANCLAFLEYETQRNILVDGTLFGMGKSAGNAPLELLGMRMNQKYGKHYRMEPMLEGIRESLMDIYAESPWGYKIFFYLCGAHRCHPNYLTYFQNKQNLSLSKLYRLLSEIEPEDKKLLYDENLAETLYEQYLSEEVQDEDSTEKFKKLLSQRKILVVGPGKNITLQQQTVQQWVKDENPFVISVNYIPKAIPVDCVFITNSKRYHDMTLALKEPENRGIFTLATTNVECRGGSFDFVVNRAPLLESQERIQDNSFLMLMKYFQKLGIQTVFCAGFDGYSDKEDNYCNPAMEYQFIKKEAGYLNLIMKEKIRHLRETMQIQFITFSAYDMVEDINGASI